MDGYYRIYKLDDEHRIRGVQELFCANDERAIIWLESVYDGSPVELWNGDRLVKRISAPDASAQGHGEDRQDDTTPRDSATGILVRT